MGNLQGLNFKDHLITFSQRLAIVFVRLVAMALFMGAHWGINYLFHNLLFPSDEAALARKFFDIMTLVGFSLVYVKVLWEMVELFWRLPKGSLRAREERNGES